MRNALINHRMFDGERWHDGQAVLLDGASIIDILPVRSVPEDVKAVDLAGAMLAPGFIDTQVNGGGGVLFNDQPYIDGVRAIVRAHRAFGTTALLPTLITDDMSIMQAGAEAVRQLHADPAEGVLGIHFEGPYLNKRRKGVHDESRIRHPAEDDLALICARDTGIVVLTVAPETLPDGLIGRLARAGVIVCAGHTAASYEQTNRALNEGVRGFTHLFNAMSPMGSREPGVVGAALDSVDSWCSVIVDGHHVHPASLRIAAQAKTPGKIMLVTDAMPAAATTLTAFVLQGRNVHIHDDRCVTDDGTLAGSNLTMMTAVRNAHELMACELSECLRMASLYPAEFLGIGDRCGRIAVGFQADLVAFEDDFRVSQTWVAGVSECH